MAPATKPMVWIQLSQILMDFSLSFFVFSTFMQTLVYPIIFQVFFTPNKQQQTSQAGFQTTVSLPSWQMTPSYGLESVLHLNLLCPRDPCLILTHISLSMVSPLHPFPLQTILHVLFKGHISSFLQFLKETETGINLQEHFPCLLSHPFLQLNNVTYKNFNRHHSHRWRFYLSIPDLLLRKLKCWQSSIDSYEGLAVNSGSTRL